MSRMVAVYGTESKTNEHMNNRIAFATTDDYKMMFKPLWDFPYVKHKLTISDAYVIEIERQETLWKTCSYVFYISPKKCPYVFYIPPNAHLFFISPNAPIFSLFSEMPLEQSYGQCNALPLLTSSALGMGRAICRDDPSHNMYVSVFSLLLDITKTENLQKHICVEKQRICRNINAWKENPGWYAYINHGLKWV